MAKISEKLNYLLAMILGSAIPSSLIADSPLISQEDEAALLAAALMAAAADGGSSNGTF